MGAWLNATQTTRNAQVGESWVRESVGALLKISQACE